MTTSPHAPLVPTCAVCSRAWAAKNGVPGVVLVERATIMREEPGRGYLAIVHCHGDHAIVELGHETPSDNAIRSARAFA